MLSRIRLLADHLIIRILLGIVAISFVIWGIKGVLDGMNNHDIVSFSKAQNITEIDFLKAKDQEVRTIEKHRNINLSPEDIKTMGIDSIILKRLITDRMMSYMAAFYALNINDELVIQTVKDYGIFHNDNDKFDINIFNANFRSEYQKQEYLKNVKQSILQGAIVSIFLEGFHPPKILTENIISYLAENRNIELISLDINATNKNFNVPAPSDLELEKFYQQNHDLFITAEKRQVAYLNISFSSLTSQIKIDEHEINDYYSQNAAEFKGKKLLAAKTLIESKLKEQKLEKFLFEFIKQLEDEVASGSSLKEIAEKYNFTISHASSETYDEMLKDPNIGDITESIFEMSVNEVSYPSEQSEKKRILLAEVNQISPSELKKFEDIKALVTSAWHQKTIAEENLKIFETLAKEYKPGYGKLKDLKAVMPLQIKNISVIRSENSNSNLPPELLYLIFEYNMGNNTQIVKYEDKLYFAHIKSINIDSKKAKEFTEKSHENINTTIKNGLMEELIDYFTRENNMKISSF